jgi:cell division inhibitor SulA
VRRHNIEFMIGWLDALRRDDVASLTEAHDFADRGQALAAAGLGEASG